MFVRECCCKILEKAVLNRKKFRAKFRAFTYKAEGTHALLCQSPSGPFFSFEFFGLSQEFISGI